MALTKAIKEALWLRHLASDFAVSQEITLFSDSQSAIHLAKNQVHHSRIKHIGVQFYFITGLWLIEKCSS